MADFNQLVAGLRIDAEVAQQREVLRYTTSIARIAHLALDQRVKSLSVEHEGLLGQRLKLETHEYFDAHSFRKLERQEQMDDWNTIPWWVSGAFRGITVVNEAEAVINDASSRVPDIARVCLELSDVHFRETAMQPQADELAWSVLVPVDRVVGTVEHSVEADLHIEQASQFMRR